jgi:hypothetical protein
VAGPTSGLTRYSDAYTVQHPYDLPQSARFSVTGGPTYNVWILKGDKPFKQGSGTGPRTEMRWHTGWSGTEHQWSGDVLIDQGTSGACIMQVKGATGGEASTSTSTATATSTTPSAGRRLPPGCGASGST